MFKQLLTLFLCKAAGLSVIWSVSSRSIQKLKSTLPKGGQLGAESPGKKLDLTPHGAFEFLSTSVGNLVLGWPRNLPWDRYIRFFQSIVGRVSIIPGAATGHCIILKHPLNS